MANAPHQIDNLVLQCCSILVKPFESNIYFGLFKCTGTLIALTVKSINTTRQNPFK